MVSISHSNFELKVSSFLSANFLLGSQSCILRVQWNKLKNTNLFAKSKIFLTIYDFELKKIATCWNFFGGVVKTALLLSVERFFNFLKTLCFSYRLLTFGEKKFGLMSEKNRRGCQNCFPCFTETIRRKVLSRRKVWVFLTVSENQQILWLLDKKPW